MIIRISHTVAVTQSYRISWICAISICSLVVCLVIQTPPDQMSFGQLFIDAAAAKRPSYVDALFSTVPLRIDLD